jgi:hypothetical protein
MVHRFGDYELYCPRARIAFFFSKRTSGVILNGAERSEESLCLGGAGERFFAALLMTYLSFFNA